MREKLALEQNLSFISKQITKHTFSFQCLKLFLPTSNIPLCQERAEVCPH